MSEVQDAMREAITAAIGKADDAFGYSYRMTGLIDGIETHTLFMDGFEPVSFEDREDGSRLIAERRNRLRADAVIKAAGLVSVDDSLAFADQIAEKHRQRAKSAEARIKAATDCLIQPGEGWQEYSLRLRATLATTPARNTSQIGEG